MCALQTGNVNDCALQTGNVNALEDIMKEHKEHKRHYSMSQNVLDESIMENYSRAFNLFKKRNSEHAEYPCISWTIYALTKNVQKWMFV